MAPRLDVLDQQASDAAYDRWAPIYDLVFNLPFAPSRRAAGEAAQGKREILVVGVGTGLELPLLPRAARVTGIDVSRPMLDVARRRVARLGLSADLREMDAQQLAFAESSFEMCLAPFVMSVVPDPARVLDEMWRVTRPGGEILLVNHFASQGGVKAAAEKALEGVSGWLGWRPRFPYNTVGDWLARKPEAKVIERREMPPLALFTLIRIGKPAEIGPLSVGNAAFSVAASTRQ